MGGAGSESTARVVTPVESPCDRHGTGWRLAMGRLHPEPVREDGQAGGYRRVLNEREDGGRRAVSGVGRVFHQDAGIKEVVEYIRDEGSVARSAAGGPG